MISTLCIVVSKFGLVKLASIGLLWVWQPHASAYFWEMNTRHRDFNLRLEIFLPSCCAVILKPYSISSVGSFCRALNRSGRLASNKGVTRL